MEKICDIVSIGKIDFTDRLDWTENSVAQDGDWFDLTNIWALASCPFGRSPVDFLKQPIISASISVLEKHLKEKHTQRPPIIEKEVVLGGFVAMYAHYSIALFYARWLEDVLDTLFCKVRRLIDNKQIETYAFLCIKKGVGRIEIKRPLARRVKDAFDRFMENKIYATVLGRILFMWIIIYALRWLGFLY